MTAPANLLMPNGKPWSSSAVDLYERCPLAFSLRHGPRPAGAPAPADTDSDPQRRGRVLHAGLQAALEHARIELDRTRAPIPGTLRRYHAPARKALGKAWEAERMPSDPALAAQVVEMFERALDDVAIPLPGALHGIERRYTHITRGGYPVVFGPDVTWWVDRRRGVLRVTDFKSSKVDPADVPRHPQLLRYAGWLSEMDPTIRAVEIELYALREGRGHVALADPAKIARAVARFDRIVGQALTAPPPPVPKVGPHCTACRYATGCPALAARRDGAAA